MHRPLLWSPSDRAGLQPWEHAQQIGRRVEAGVVFKQALITANTFDEHCAREHCDTAPCDLYSAKNKTFLQIKRRIGNNPIERVGLICRIEKITSAAEAVINNIRGCD